MRNAEPDIILLAAARVGGILANMAHPVEFLYENMTIATNVIGAARKYSVKKLLYLGSSCIYPRNSPQPIREEALLTGPLEETNEAYAIAKITGLKLVQACNRQYGHDFITAMPTNLYGLHDNFDLNSSHVIPALIRKIHEAKRAGRRTVQIWGSGTPRREFLHVDDLADACVFLVKHYSSPDIINVGAGSEVTILELAEIIADVIGYDGTFTCDTSKPDGVPRKLLDTSRMQALGWRPSIGLREGLARTYAEWKSLEAAMVHPSGPHKGSEVARAVS